MRDADKKPDDLTRDALDTDDFLTGEIKLLILRKPEHTKEGAETWRQW